MTDGRPAIYRLRDVTKTRSYGSNSFVFSVPSLTIGAGEVVALKGASGSGKSTLLDLLAGTLRPDTAETFEFAPDGNGAIDIAALWRRSARDRLTALRGTHIGYVLQTGGLLPYLSARDNIALSARLLGRRIDGEIDRIVARLGIARLLDKKPGQLSVGERQRVAIARALAHRPTVVLADEPTASVDPIVGDQIFALFIDLVATLGATAIIASHDWDRLEAAGLRSLHHKLERDGDATRSYFWS